MKHLMILVSVALFLAACGGAANVNVNVSNSNANAKANANAAASPTAAPSSSPAAGNKNSASAPAPKKDDDSDIQGQLQVGKTDSVILYLGGESGDYAGYCFANDSDAGKAIMAACKDKQQCHVTGAVDNSASCKVPGLEADLSASGRILSVTSAKAVAGKK